MNSRRGRGSYSRNNYSAPATVPYLAHPKVEFDDDAWEEDSSPAPPPVTQATNDYQRKRPPQTYSSRNSRPTDSCGSRTFTSDRRGNSQQNYRNRNEKEELEFSIPSKFVGKVIGKGGDTIRELQQYYNSKIIIERNSSGDSTGVTLKGSQSTELEELKNYILELISEKKANGTKYESREAREARTDSFFERRRIFIETAPPIKKDFYVEDPEVSNMSKEFVAQFRKSQNNITVMTLSEEDKTPIPNPITEFRQAFDHYPEIMDEIEKQGFTTPTPIQCQSWPILLQGRDMIGIAQTGTGKTLAYLLPAFVHIEGQSTPLEERPGPTAVILAPTRELAQQIEQETKKYSYKNIRSVCLFGGRGRVEQIENVGKGVEIIIATPGRLGDLVTNSLIDLSCVSYLVLDEADRMLDMGFHPQISKVIAFCRPGHQTVMMSATWPPDVRSLAMRHMTNAVQVFIGTLDLRAVHTVCQRIILVDEAEKFKTLFDFLSTMEPSDKVMVFVDRKALVDDIASELALTGVDCQSIHGDRDQEDREAALEDFRTGAVQILVATDVASRGLDIYDVTHIFNYDFPRNVEEYVHRVGRTGRAGRTGESITLFTRNDWRHAKELIDILVEANQEVPDELHHMARRYQEMLERKRAEDDAYGFKGGRGRRGGGGRRSRW